MPLPLSARRAFEAAAAGLGLGLGLTPSAVSHAVHCLERSLSSTLFLRQRRTILLTAD